MKKLLCMALVGFMLAAAPLTTDQQHLVTLLMNKENGSKVLQDLKEGSAGLTDEAIIQHVKNYISENLGITDPDKITKVESNLASLLAGNIDASTLTYHDTVNLYDIADYLNVSSKVLESLKPILIDKLKDDSVKRLPQREESLKEALEKVIADKGLDIFSLSVELNEIKDQMVSLLSLDRKGTLVSRSEVDNKLKELKDKWTTYKGHLDTIITATINAAQFKDIDVSNMKEVIKISMISPMIEQLTPVFDSLKNVSRQYTYIRADFADRAIVGTILSIFPPFAILNIIKAIGAIIYEFVDLIKIKLGLPLSLSVSDYTIFSSDATLAGTGEALDRIEQASQRLENIFNELQDALVTVEHKPVSAGRLEQSSDNDITDDHINKAPVMPDTHTTVTVQQPDAATKVTTDLQAQLPGIKQFIDDLDANERQNENTILEQISKNFKFSMQTESKQKELHAFRTYIKNNGAISPGEHDKILTILTKRPELKPFMVERDIAIPGEHSVYKELMA